MFTLKHAHVITSMCNIHAFSINDLQIHAKMRFCERILITSSEAISIFFLLKSESGLQMCCSTAICIVYVLFFNMQ
jgi:hypothetical protein